MSAIHPRPGDVLPLIPEIAEAQPGTLLIRAAHVEVFRLVLPRGKTLDEHRAAGAITIQCLSGRVEITALGKTQVMPAGTLIYLPDREPHAVTAIDDSLLLISMWLRRK